MLFWIVDNVGVVLLVLGLVALGFGAAWWSTRKHKLLIGVAVPLVLMAVAWGLSLFVVTDRMQLERNVDAIRDAVNAGNLDEALTFFEDQVDVELASGKVVGVKKEQMAALANRNKSHYQVKKVFTSSFRVEELSRPKAVAKFVIITDQNYRGWCTTGWVRGPDGKWRVHSL